MSEAPRQYAVQRTIGRTWTTLDLRPRREEATALFAETVRTRPRHVLRLIQVDFKPGSTCGEFDWLLLDLYDPRKLGLVPDLAPEAPGSVSGPLPGSLPGSLPRSLPEPVPGRGRQPTRRRGREAVRTPWALYAGFFALGAAAVAAAWLAVLARAGG
ncbi:hypothetical protein [Arenibaculum pallidiluteum]|uniref:hypothetical protein n=1 Tax=Arenibaculum pallidiluteum TaxID=2812559 RepID=UPI001A978609|nr:hypothetical protein [Arenibaculum pallidiluteum]